ncbi:hypothetical protein [Marinobacter sp.]|uniref:hypothetical protein n=1 Tax=Marinobacter sp. TaxID=50741 RepID=UPI002B49DCAF|nr:hypothetical protein [Marinobacter sp.]HKK54729.1 hypothetical protein [Marinobacter sp.]
MISLLSTPDSASAMAQALVGKGICFDTGGSNLKTGGGMLGMHVNMASSGTHKGGLAQIPTDLQGYGVRFGVEWLSRIADGRH